MREGNKVSMGKGQSRSSVSHPADTKLHKDGGKLVTLFILPDKLAPRLDHSLPWTGSSCKGQFPRAVILLRSGYQQADQCLPSAVSPSEIEERIYMIT